MNRDKHKNKRNQQQTNYDLKKYDLKIQSLIQS